MASRKVTTRSLIDELQDLQRKLDNLKRRNFPNEEDYEAARRQLEEGIQHIRDEQTAQQFAYE